MEEAWRPVPGWPGYEVSDLGRLGSWLKSPNESKRPLRRRILKGGRDKDGYRRAVLCNSGLGRRSSMRVAHLVARVFIGPKPFPKAVLRHLDGVNDNDQADNLAWGTQAENMADKSRHGTQRGETHPRATISEEKAAAILKASRSGRHSTRQLADRFGVSVAVAYNIEKRRSWRHLA